MCIIIFVCTGCLKCDSTCLCVRRLCGQSKSSGLGVCVCVCLHAHTHIPGHSWVIPSTETEKGPFDSSPFLWFVEWGLRKDLILLILISRHTQTDRTFAMVIHQVSMSMKTITACVCACERESHILPYIWKVGNFNIDKLKLKLSYHIKGYNFRIAW